ncbi:MAG: hypothetical protein LWW98_07920 [Deltaproteobacteria bacterium]|nr:hypothetical protein [Deltaproteobacteria bacterium]
MEKRWIFLIALLPFVLFALAGYQYGAFLLYMVPAIFCVVQYFYPTIILWGIFFLTFISGAGVYLYLLFSDLYKLATGVRPQALLDFDDSIVFITLVLVLVWIAYILFISRPDLSFSNTPSGNSNENTT